MKKLLSLITLLFIGSIAFSQITITSTVTNVSCFGGATGSATIISTGGNAPYTYSITAPPQSNGTGIFSGLLAGTYSVIVSDAMAATNSITFTITEPSQILLNVTSIPALCNGTSTGTINITSVIGGNPAFTYNLNGGAYQGSSTFLNVPAGVLLVGVKDINGCIGSNTVQVTEAPQLITSISSQTNISCFGLCNGIFNISASGGTFPYGYFTSFGSAVPTNSNVCAGVHTYTVADANGCLSSGTVNITQPSQFTAMAIASNNVSCFGLSDGNASAAGIGGIGAPYTYSWSPSGQTSATATNLAPGTYSVTITNFGGCTATATVNIFQPSPLNAIVNANNALCFGTNTGTVTVAGTGGTAPYSYLWTTLASTSATVTNIGIGMYPVVTTDANGCTITKTVVVNQPSQLMATTTTTNTSCFGPGSCNGAFSINVTGGIAPYTFSNNIGPISANNINQCAGTQTLTISDANNCAFQLATTINQPSSITAVITATNSNCGQANGALCATFSGGTSPYTSIWSNGVTVLCNNLIPAGAYTYTVTDMNGCSAIASGLVNDIGAPVVSIASQTNVLCFGGMNGGATASVNGGVTPYTFSWTGAISSTISSASNLGAGMYGVSVTDAAGCVGTQSVLISQPQQLTASISNFSNSCFGGCNGTASVLAMGGNPGYTFNWNTAPVQSSSTINNICPGNWICLVTDGNGCSATATVNITQLPPLTINLSYTNATCGGACDGQASPSITGGSGTTTFLWLPGLQTGNTVNNLCTGTQTLMVTDNGTCVYTETFVINQGTSTISNATLTSVSYAETCLNTNDGAIDLSITGSNSGPFTYQWSNGSTMQDISNLNSGIYSVAVFDASMNCLTITDTVHFDNSNCGTITGNVFIDNNSDCIKNSGDNNLYSIQIVANPGNRLGYTNFNGDYAFYNIPFGSYIITANTSTVTMQTTCSTNTLTTTINSTTPNSINNNFVRQYIPVTQPDLFVSAYSNGIVPGFVCYVNYYLSNLNNISATGLFKAVLPSAFISTITTGNPNTYTISGDTIIWNFNNITNATGSNYFTINFTTPLTNPLGSIFTTCMWAQPTVTDLNYVNNTTCYQRMVTGSFDLNDKTVSPVGIGANGDIAATETDLTYLIRFQNTGNGPAVNIYVKDTLSPNVDINTFEMLSASHNYMIDVLPGNVLRWKFNNIMLPDSNSNEPASHGYIQYRIKRTNNNTPGTQIKNTAYIYFDFNEPVVTNTAINTIETITGIKSSSSNNDEWNVYPNPSTGILYIANSSSVKEESQIQVINSIGQTVLEETITNNYKNIDLSKLNNGVYFVKIVSDKQSVIKRVVLSR